MPKSAVAAAHPAVEQYLQFVRGGSLGYGRERVYGSYGSFKLSATLVGDDNSCRAMLGGEGDIGWV